MKDLQRRLWEKLPEKYQHLECEVFIGDSGVQLEMHESLVLNLRPTEIMVDLQILVDRMSKEEIIEAKKTLLIALKDFDASVVIPNHPAHGPRTSEGGSTSSGVRRSDDRPVFGSSSHLESPSDFQGAPKRARRAMESVNTARGSAAVVEKKLIYNRMPALSNVQNELFSCKDKMSGPFRSSLNVTITTHSFTVRKSLTRAYGVCVHVGS